MIYTTKQALEYLGISNATLFKYLKDPRMPLNGMLLNPRVRIFSQIELDQFRAFMQTDAFKEMTQRGRKPENPITKTIIDEDGNKKRVYMRFKNRRAKYGLSKRKDGGK